MADKKPVPVDLPEEELKKLAGKTVKKGETEYVIVVQGVDSGLCGKYWGDLDNLPSRQKNFVALKMCLLQLIEQAVEQAAGAAADQPGQGGDAEQQEGKCRQRWLCRPSRWVLT